MKKISLGLQIAIGFILIMGVSLLGSYFFGKFPSPQEACEKKCREIGKIGDLVYEGPATPKQLYKDTHSTCRCQ